MLANRLLGSEAKHLFGTHVPRSYVPRGASHHARVGSVVQDFLCKLRSEAAKLRTAECKRRVPSRERRSMRHETPWLAADDKTPHGVRRAHVGPGCVRAAANSHGGVGCRWTTWGGEQKAAARASEVRDTRHHLRQKEAGREFRRAESEKHVCMPLLWATSRAGTEPRGHLERARLSLREALARSSLCCAVGEVCQAEAEVVAEGVGATERMRDQGLRPALRSRALASTT